VTKLAQQEVINFTGGALTGVVNSAFKEQ